MFIAWMAPWLCGAQSEPLIHYVILEIPSSQLTAVKKWLNLPELMQRSIWWTTYTNLVILGVNKNEDSI